MTLPTAVTWGIDTEYVEEVVENQEALISGSGSRRAFSTVRVAGARNVVLFSEVRVLTVSKTA